MCTSPMNAWVVAGGGKTGRRLTFVMPPDGGEPLKVGCGGCMECRLRKTGEWTVRLVHESKMHARNSFVTLTYNDDHLPPDYSLQPRDVQLFMKRLRLLLGVRIRFFACGEYGDLFSRPHYHVLIFGEDFAADRYVWKKPKANPYYRSAMLEKAWSIDGKPIGNCEIGEVTPDSCAYVAKYCMKKITGPAAEDHYLFRDDNGVLHNRHPEFVRMSNRPGIGRSFFEKFERELFANDSAILKGREVPLPRYYERLVADRSLEERERVEQMKIAREVAALERCPEEPTELRRSQIEAYHVEMSKRKVRGYDG